MPAKTKRKAPKRKLSTRFKQEPIATSKREWNKIGPVGKVLLVSVVAGATSLQLTNEINKIPVVGGVLSAFTGLGQRFRMPSQ